MNRMTLAIVLSVGTLAGIFALLNSGHPAPSGEPAKTQGRSEPVSIFCAASNRAVMEAVIADYEQETGHLVDVQYGPSQTLLSSIEVSGTGDLYLPADDTYLMMGRHKSLIAEIIPVATQRGVIVVRRGNPKNINSLQDLFRDDVRFVQANPEGAAIGKVTKRTLSAQQLWDQADKATTAYRITVTEVANDILVDAADAGIVYDAVLNTYPDLTSITVPELEDTVSDIAVGVIKSSKQPQKALHFARYLAARDRGLKRYQEFGFQILNGDVWSTTPEISVFAGSMLRPAIDKTITAFEEREGVRVTRVYNGCGILVAQMKAGQHPDAYFACDKEFMQQVPDLFPQPVDVSENELVILVQKGNPHKIASLKDLTNDGLRVGVGHEKQCAMGWLTQNTLKEGGVQEAVMENVTVQSPTGDMLVNQLRTGSLDAAVAYLSNAAGAAEYLDAVQIKGLECSVAVQPFAISPDSPNRQLSSRLFERICSTESQQDFIAEGFRWQLKRMPY